MKKLHDLKMQVPELIIDDVNDGVFEVKNGRFTVSRNSLAKLSKNEIQDLFRIIIKIIGVKIIK